MLRILVFVGKLVYFHMVYFYLKSCKSDCVLPKLKLSGGWCHYDDINQASPLLGKIKSLNCKSYEQRKDSSTNCHVLHIWYCFIKVTGVAIPWGDVALWCHSITVAYPWCDESGEVTVVFMKRDTVITISTVKTVFFSLLWTMRDYFLQTWYVRVASRVAERHKT